MNGRRNRGDSLDKAVRHAVTLRLLLGAFVLIARLYELLELLFRPPEHAHDCLLASAIHHVVRLYVWRVTRMRIVGTMCCDTNMLGACTAARAADRTSAIASRHAFVCHARLCQQPHKSARIHVCVREYILFA
jgi:hypothetical protein